MSDFDLPLWLERSRAAVETALTQALPEATTEPRTIHEAMRHSVFAGGKRLRPLLTLAAAEACGGRAEDALPAACAMECLHTYSLIHDDLPAMDDDDFRRGHPTCHKVFGEAIGILAGDALQALAFELIGRSPVGGGYTHADLLRTFAVTAGSRKLIGGQVLDLQAEGRGSEATLEELRAIHLGKTAAMISCSMELGAMTAGVAREDLAAMARFGTTVGLAFQVIDDILDVTQSTEELGKTAGKDSAANKATYPAVLGLENSQNEAERLTREATEALAHFDGRAAALRALAHHLLRRRS
ncbi:MAG: polyprenyl synthetase family protein [Verrucomicrobiota bacterium]